MISLCIYFYMRTNFHYLAFKNKDLELICLLCRPIYMTICALSQSLFYRLLYMKKSVCYFSYCQCAVTRFYILFIQLICFLLTDMISALSSLSSEEKKDPCISFCLSFRSAYSLNNYHKMFKLYSDPPKMTGYLIDMFAERERIRALKTLVKAYVSIYCIYLFELFELHCKRAIIMHRS